MYILLDIVFDENHYSKLISKPIKNELLITREPYIEVSIPSPDCLMGDKLTAFAPHTTGIHFGEDKELEIIKQLYDVACLFEVVDSFEDVYKSYMATVKAEVAFRGLDATVDGVLNDTIEAALCVVGKGKVGAEYPLFFSGIKGLVNHVYDEKFTGETAAFYACRVLYASSCILKESPFMRMTDFDKYSREDLAKTRLSKLGYMKKVDIESFAYLVEAAKLLG